MILRAKQKSEERTKFERGNDDSEIESTDKNHFVEKEIMIFKARLINQIPD